MMRGICRLTGRCARRMRHGETVSSVLHRLLQLICHIVAGIRTGAATAGCRYKRLHIRAVESAQWAFTTQPFTVLAVTDTAYPGAAVGAFAGNAVTGTYLHLPLIFKRTGSGSVDSRQREQAKQ
tara:strand:- start:6476 stop:6847 length:372 start_codon:yes stop_codon:yes gene_type:complete